MDAKLIETLGDELYQAMMTQTVVDPLTSRYPDITIENAYHVQQRMVARRVQAGERVVGKKIGVTSAAVMNMLGVYQPDFGYLLDGMIYNEGDAIDTSTLIQPKAEGEIAFILKKDLMGPGVTAADVMAATEGVMACFEIVDSRIRDWKIKIQATVADNASCGVFVRGDRAGDPRRIDLSTCGMVLEKNGEIIGTGAGAQHKHAAGGVVGHGVLDLDLPVADARIDDLEARHHALGGGQHVGVADAGAHQVFFKGERDFTFGFGLNQGADVDRLAFVVDHAVEQITKVRLVHAQHVHHRSGGDANFFADDTLARLQPTRQHALLNVVRVLNGDVGVAAGQRLDHRAGGHGVVQLVAQGFDQFGIHSE